MVTSPGGALWFSGGNGIFRFSAAAFRQKQGGQDTPPDYTWFGRTDGMASTQCSIGTPNMALEADRKLWVCTVHGLAMLDLSHLRFDSAKPSIFVEEVTVGRERHAAGRELVLPPGTHHVELRFDSISLARPEKIRFQYRMDGVDPVWLEADNSLTAMYTNIPVGTHAFRIRACNSDGVWDLSGISFPVTQKPYLYQTGWFRLVAIVAFVLTLTGGYRLRLHKIRSQMNERFNERVEERTRIARDLHDTLLQSFQGLMLRLQVVDDLVPEGKAKEQLEQTLKRADQAIAEGRSAVCDLRSSTMITSDLAQAVRALGKELATQDATTFRLVVEGPPRDMDPIIRDELYRITREALRNAYNHARAHQIEVEITYAEQLFRLRIRDDGVGITPEFLGQGRPGHYGMTGMRERARQIGAKLNIWSGTGTGTEIELSIPASNAYDKSPKRSRWRLFREKVG
jgi:signal transduction histidine kinase